MSNYQETEQYFNENKYFNPVINNYPFFIKNKKFNPNKKLIFLSDKKEHDESYFKSKNIRMRKVDNVNEDFDYICQTNTINYNYDIPKTSINKNKRRNFSDVNLNEEQEENYNYYKNKQENN